MPHSDTKNVFSDIRAPGGLLPSPPASNHIYIHEPFPIKILFKYPFLDSEPFLLVLNLSVIFNIHIQLCSLMEESGTSERKR